MEFASVQADVLADPCSLAVQQNPNASLGTPKNPAPIILRHVAACQYSMPEASVEFRGSPELGADLETISFACFYL